MYGENAGIAEQKKGLDLGLTSWGFCLRNISAKTRSAAWQRGQEALLILLFQAC
jgi:hypothetical protein